MIGRLLYYSAHTIKVWRIALHSKSRTDESESEGRQRMSVIPIVAKRFFSHKRHILLYTMIIEQNNLRKSERSISHCATFPFRKRRIFAFEHPADRTNGSLC